MKFTSSLCALAAATSLLRGEVTIPVYDLAGALTENGVAAPNLLGLDTNPRRPLTHFDVVTSLERAAQSEDVPAVVFEVDQASLSLAQIEEMRRALLTLKEAGKEVWLYADSLNFQTALLGSAASQLVLNPEGDVSMSGLHSENLYFKKMLDQVGVVVDVVHIGDFKSAGENYYRTAPSAPAQKQSDILLDSLYNTLLTEVAVGRGITRDSLSSFVDQGVTTAEEAKELGVIDRLQYRTDLVEELTEKFGVEATFDRDYARNGEEEPEIKGFFDLMKLLFSSGKDTSPQHPYVGVVVLDGGIDMASITPVRDEVLKLVDDEQCEALVLRVNSPGGSALASEILWEALDEFAESERPFVVSMGSVAASGGYYVAAGADVIFAEPTTITGSIGVVGMKFALGGVMEKLGITTHENKRGAHADLYNTTRAFSKVERGMVRDSMLDVYGTFKQRVMDGRGERLVGDLEKLAGGRVYSGRDALRIGLVDEMGGLGEAINRAAKLAELEESPAYLFPKPQSALDTLFEQPSDGDQDDEFITMAAEADPSQLLRLWLAENGQLSWWPADKKAALQFHLQQLKSLQNNQIQLIAPPLPSF